MMETSSAWMLRMSCLKVCLSRLAAFDGTSEKKLQRQVNLRMDIRALKLVKEWRHERDCAAMRYPTHGECVRNPV